MATRAKSDVDVKRLILVPAIISFAVTILRLVGELNDWSPTFFSREPGGGGAIIGISWLVPIFGVYFAWKLIDTGHAPEKGWKVILLAVAGALASMLILVPSLRLGPRSALGVALIVIAAAVGVLLQRIAWPALFRTLVAYAFAARVPVVLVMLVAILGDWGTHYDVAPPGDFPAMSPLAKWFFIGAVPQLTFWILYTVVIGALSGGITAVVVRVIAPREAPQAS